MRRQGRWYERDMTRRKPSRARLRPFRLDDAADLCRIYPMFFVDTAVERWAELDELHVHPGYQGRGIGTRLVRSAVREARAAGFAVMYLVAEASNVSARRVYEKNGFREHNRIVRYKIEL